MGGMGGGGESLWVCHSELPQHVSGRKPGLRLHSQEPRLVSLHVVLSETWAPAPPHPVPPSSCALSRQVAELQDQAVAQSQEQAILQRSLQDKAAEVEVERMGAKVCVPGRGDEASGIPPTSSRTTL